MKGIDKEFFIKHSIDPDNELFTYDIFAEDYIGDARDDRMEEEGLDEEDWTGSF